MFVCGHFFPASEGNKISADKVAAKVEAALGDELGKVKEIKIYEGSNKSEKVELKTTLTDTDSFFAKALVQFFKEENEAREPKYLVYTNKYQISQYSKQLDKGNAEIESLCRYFDGMEPVHLEVVY